jgi:hypothetical protein
MSLWRRDETFTLDHIFKERQYAQSLLIALLLLAAAFAAEHFANLYEFEYLARPTSVYVGDLLLDNLPSIDLNVIIVEGSLFTILFGGLYIIFWRPRYILFTIKALAIAIALRAFFISLTHVGIHPASVPTGLGFFEGIYSYFNLQTGFFFSGHTALTFLTACIFWRRPTERAIFLFLSFLFGAAVLLAHIHYSIDVFAAPFMAYGIFNIAYFLFPRDYELIVKEPRAS